MAHRQTVPADYDGQIGDGEKISTVIESDGDEERCPYCGEWYSKIGIHWSRGSCHYPPISEYKMQLLRGMMFGDGNLDTTNKNPRFRIGMINTRFLQWLDSEFGWLTNGLTMKRTCVETAKSVCENLGGDTQPEDGYDLYCIKTKSHPQFERFISWYDSGEIVFPFGFSVSGDLRNRSNGYSSVRFSSANESNRPAHIKGALEEHGFTVGVSGYKFRLSTEDTEDFFEFIGDPVPGFEYKWAYEDYDEYHRLKDQCKEEYCTRRNPFVVGFSSP